MRLEEKGEKGKGYSNKSKERREITGRGERIIRKRGREKEYLILE